jgi:hypothetical protein
MLNRLGINLDWANWAAGRPEPADLGLFQWARILAKPKPGEGCPDNRTLGGYVKELRDAGLRVIVTLVKESFSPEPEPHLHLDETRQKVAEYARTITADCWQIGNEPDAQPGPGSESSWIIVNPSLYTELALACREVIKSVTGERDENPEIITAGLCSGNAGWLHDCGPSLLDPLNGLDGVAIHPYGQRPDPTYPTPTWGVADREGDDVHDLLDRYNLQGKKLWITEYGTEQMELYPEYGRRMYLALHSRADLRAACFFCYHDGMVKPRGLVDEQNNKKMTYTLLEALDS